MSVVAPKFWLEGWMKEEGPENGWQLKDDAPEWARKEYEEFMARMDNEPDENGRRIIY